MQDRELIPTESDKDDLVVVLLASTCLALAHEHLRENKTYQHLHEDTAQEPYTRFYWVSSGL